MKTFKIATKFVTDDGRWSAVGTDTVTLYVGEDEDCFCVDPKKAVEIAGILVAAAREAGYKVKRQPRGTAAAVDKAAKK